MPNRDVLKLEVEELEHRIAPSVVHVMMNDDRRSSSRRSRSSRSRRSHSSRRSSRSRRSHSSRRSSGKAPA